MFSPCKNKQEDGEVKAPFEKLTIHDDDLLSMEIFESDPKCQIDCKCSQKLLYQFVRPSVKAIIVEGEPLMHHYGYIVPACSQFDSLPLSKKYPYERENNIVFYDPDNNPVHRYIVKGEVVAKSCTGIVHDFCPDFQTSPIIFRMTHKDTFPEDDKYIKYRPLPIFCPASEKDRPIPVSEQLKMYINLKSVYKDKLYKIEAPASPYLPWKKGFVICPHFLLVDILISNQWDANKDDASEEGVRLHESCEYLANEMMSSPQVSENKSVEFGYAKQFFDDMLENECLVPFRTEIMVYDEESDCCGSDDLVLQSIDDVHNMAGPNHIKDVYVVDHKRSKKISSTGFSKMFPPMQEYDDCNYCHYMLQVNIYAYLLEKHHHVRVIGLMLTIFHPNNKGYLLIPVPRLKELTESILNQRIKDVAERNRPKQKTIKKNTQQTLSFQPASHANKILPSPSKLLVSSLDKDHRPY